MQTERLIVVGEIVRPHGVRGEMRVLPQTDHPSRFSRLRDCVLWDPARDRREPRQIRSVRAAGASLLVAFTGCESPEAARELTGWLIAVPEGEALPAPEGTFYPWQMEGALVVTEDGREIGRMTGVDQGPGQDRFVVRDGSREHLIPAVPDIVVEVDVAGRRVVIRPPDGLLDL